MPCNEGGVALKIYVVYRDAPSIARSNTKQFLLQNLLARALVELAPRALRAREQVL